MGSVAPRLKGPEYAFALFQQIKALAEASIETTGDIDPEPIATALEHALKIPECRDAVIHLTARYLACCLTGCTPDIPLK
jgi:hypothetical protein